jgi:hypothetical protein
VTDSFWQPPPAGSPVGQGWTPGQPGPPGPPPSGGPQKPPGRSRVAVVVGVTAVVCALLGALAGSIAGVVVTRDDKSMAAPSTTPAPSAAEVDAQTRDLCTRFVSAYAILPTENQQGLDVIAVVNYIDLAFRDNPIARQDIRNSIGDWLREARLWVAALGQQSAHGYVDFPEHWTGRAANAASSQAVASCRAG